MPTAKRTRPPAPKRPPVPPAPVTRPTESPLTDAMGRAVTVVHVAAELAPFARTGGLGEAVSSLAHYQARSGIPTLIFMPLYRQVHGVVRDLQKVGEPFPVQVGPRREEGQLYESTTLAKNPSMGKPRILFVDNPTYFDRDAIYGDSKGDYGDNHRRWAFFSLAVLNALPQVAPTPVLLHCHDWHTALALVYLRAYGRAEYARHITGVLSVHNAGYQGHFPPWVIEDVGLPWEMYNYHMLEWYDRVNFLKGGMSCADAVVTVSPSHAHELRTPAGGFGLHEHFVGLRERFVGIVNGIDQTEWDPATDPHITANYTINDFSGKKKCKTALQRLFGLPQRTRTPIIGMSARMVYQKGLDLILGSPRFLSLDAQFIFLGQGEKKYVDVLRELALHAPGRIGTQTNFTTEQEHKLLGGADMIVMPSQYEPCGLTQMRAQRYGVPPVARKVGGLADTIEDNITGFLFDAFTETDFLSACARAIDHYQHADTWEGMMREAMSRDFSWERSEEKYRALYRRALAFPRWRR